MKLIKISSTMKLKSQMEMIQNLQIRNRKLASEKEKSLSMKTAFVTIQLRKFNFRLVRFLFFHLFACLQSS